MLTLAGPLVLVWPLALLALPLPALAFLLLPRARRLDAALRIPFFRRLEGLAAHTPRKPALLRWRQLLAVLAWLALLAAAAKPQWIGDPIKLPASGRDLMLAVDVSGSMGVEDMKIGARQVTRLTAVKAVVGDFVERRTGDRLGLILFGTRPYLQTPLTFDRRTVRTLLEETPLAVAGKATAIGDAIGLAVKRLRDRPQTSRVMILLTDGANTAGEVSPLQAARLASQADVRIYTIGIGADEMIMPGLLFNRRINPSTDLDEDTLTEIAGSTGGRYFRARNTRELADIYRELDTLEPVEQDQETFRPVKSLFHWPLALALLLTFLIPLLDPRTPGLLRRALAAPAATGNADDDTGRSDPQPATGGGGG